MSWSIDFKKGSISFVNIFQITIENEFSSRNWEPIIVLGLVVLNFIISRYELIPFLNRVELIFGSFGVMRLDKDPSEVDEENGKEGYADVLVEFVLLTLNEFSLWL